MNTNTKFHKALTSLFDRDLSKHQKIAKDHCQLLVVHGSHAYGAHDAESDVDLRGIFVPPKECYYGLYDLDSVSFNRKDGEELDVLHSVKRFFKLASQGRAGIVDLLFVDSEFILSTGTHGNFLLENRHVFLSQKCIHSMLGFCKGSLGRAIRQGSVTDKKALAHCFRLVFQAKNLLESLNLNLRLDEKSLEIYRAVRSGELHSQHALDYLDRLKVEVEHMLGTTALRPDVDVDKVNSLLIEFTDMVLKEGG